MDLLEIIVPLIFAAIYFFGNMMSGKNEDESAPVPRRGNEDQEADTIERQRRIQEEIRRKIMERRRGSSGTASPSEPAEARSQESPTDRDLRQRREAVQRRRAEREHQKRASAAATRSAPAVDPPEEFVASSELEPAFSWDSSDNAYESQIQARLQQIEATKRRAAQLKEQAGGLSQGNLGASPRRTDTYKDRIRLSGPIRSTLKDPAAARAAFIYAEVLGPPISERKKSSIPGLS